jgi:putative Mn2+ efflux pump MntP
VTILESTLIVLGLSANVLLIGQYEGTMISRIEWKALGLLSLIVLLFETGAMLAGYMLAGIPFFRNSESSDLRKFCYFVAALLFLLIAGYMIYKALRREVVQEHLRSFGMKRIVLEVLVVALFTFMAGIGWGFIGHNIYMATGVIGCATVLAAIGGIWMGYTQGCRLRYAIYGTGGAMLAFVGADILVRYL